MLKKTLRLIATSIQEIDEKSSAENLVLCSTCKTFYDSEYASQNNKTCLYCSKKIDQFGKIKIFTFKPCVYFFYKVGYAKIDLEHIESEQIKHGMKTNFLEYNVNNMVWYVYRDVEPNKIYKIVSELFDMFKMIEFSNKSCIKNTCDKFKYAFVSNKKHISIQMVVSDLINCELEFSTFLPRDRIFF